MKGRKGFTYVEIITVGLLLASLAAVLYPVFTRAIEKARMADCQARLRQIGMALQVYARDWNGQFPPSKDDLSPLLPYLREPDLLLCPTARAQNVKPPHYWYRPGHAFDDLHDVPLAGDVKPWHNGGGNVLFVDGHVKWFIARIALPGESPFHRLKAGERWSALTRPIKIPPPPPPKPEGGGGR